MDVLNLAIILFVIFLFFWGAGILFFVGWIKFYSKEIVKEIKSAKEVKPDSIEFQDPMLTTYVSPLRKQQEEEIPRIRTK